MIGAVSLLLWGTHFVNKSIVSVFGAGMRNIISNSTNNRMTSFLTGFGITSLLQSSTATTLMAASFIEKKMLGLRAAIAIVIGADLSTTIIAQLLVFDVSWLSPMFIALGGFFALRKSKTTARLSAIGNAFIGLGVILLSLALIRETSLPLKESTILADILIALGKDNAMAILFSAIITLLIHSSLATVLFYAALTSQGIISLDLAVFLIIGANIGGSLIPYFATLGGSVDKKRLMIANIGMRVSTALLILLTLHHIMPYIEAIPYPAGRTLVILHTGYNLVLALLFMPIVPYLTSFMEKAIPAPASQQEQSYLEEVFLERPSLALSSAMRETLRMADLVQEMTEMSFQAIKSNDNALLKIAKKSDDQLDSIYKKVTRFLTRLDKDTLTSDEIDQYDRIMSFATNLEHSGDVVQHSMSKAIAKKIKSGRNFSDDGWEEISSFYTTILANIKTAQSIFMSHSLNVSADLIRSKKKLKSIELVSRNNHFTRLSDNNHDSIATSSVHIDLMRDLGRINSYVTSIAYETLNRASEENAG